MCWLTSAIWRSWLSVSVTRRHHSLIEPFFWCFFNFFQTWPQSHWPSNRPIKYDLTIGFPLPVNICPLMWAHRCCQSRSPVRNQFKRRGRLEHQQRINVFLRTSCVFNSMKGKNKTRGAVMSVFHPRLICSFYCAIVEQETSPCLQPIQLNLMHLKERAFHTPGTLFCTAHLFLPLQARESLLNMLHPRSTINLSFLHLPFSCFFFPRLLLLHSRHIPLPSPHHSLPHSPPPPPPSFPSPSPVLLCSLK